MIVTTTPSVEGMKIMEYRGLVFGEVVAGVVRRTRQRAGRHHQEALGPGDRLIGLELFWRDEAVDGGVFARWLQVLADGDEVDAGGPHVVHHLHDLFLGLAQADHDAGLGDLVGVALLDHLQ